MQDDRRDQAAEASSETRIHLTSAEERQQMIAMAAYFRAQGRDFEPGREIEDWLAAEAEIDEKLSAEA